MLAAAVVGISTMLSASYQQSSGQAQSAQALTLAAQLLEEIAARPIELPDGTSGNPGWPEGETNRALYDTVGDYHGYTDTSTSMTALDGTTFTAIDGQAFTRAVSMTAGAAALPAAYSIAPADDLSLVTVTVTTPQGRSVAVSRLFTRVDAAR